MTKDEWYRQLFERFANSKFRSSFHLKQKDNDYINEKGIGDVVDGNIINKNNLRFFINLILLGK